MEQEKFDTVSNRVAMRREKLWRSAGDFNPHDQPSMTYTSTDLLDCIIVLGTLAPDGAREYRVGRFSNQDELRTGLFTHTDPGDWTTSIALRPDTTQNCFGSSHVYDSRDSAVADAEVLFPNNSGIKVIHTLCTYPQ